MKKVEFNINERFIDKLSSLVMIPSWLKIKNAVMCWESNEHTVHSGVIFLNDGDLFYELDVLDIYDLHDLWFMDWILNLKK